jgi:outer membrane protein OmpA-like peptidoglycan-associated protein
MGRLSSLVALGLGLFAGLFSEATAFAAPPALPEGDVGEGTEPPPADPAPADPAPAADPGAAPADPAPDAGVDASADLSASGEVELPGDRPGADADAEAEGGGRRNRRGGGEDEAGDPDDPGMVRGRREPMMPMNRGSVGLFNTALPDVGGKYTFRFRLHTDFFRKDAFIYNGPPEPDKHARVRGGVTLGFSPFSWGELFFSVNSQANRNQRDQAGRQDAETMFALGDIDFGLKGAYRFKNGIGVGGQMGLGLLSGSQRLFTDGVNFWFDGLFAVDVRYLTKKHFPFRFTTNIGWMLDRSLSTTAPYGSITDDVSREVTRFSLGANHSRVRMRYAIDFPVRLGKERQFGIDPIVEWAWDVATQEEIVAFGRPGTEASPLPRGSQWLTLGVRGNVVSGLHLDVAVDIGLVSPNYEFGPPVPPWQVMLGLGWSFDPNPTIKEVEVASETPPPPPEKIAEGRIVGQVTDPQGTPIPEARISFPGLTSTAILTDTNGSFTSFRFPAGTVTVQVTMNGQVVKETTAEVKDGEDTPLTIQLDSGPAPATGITQGSVTDPTGKPVTGKIRVVGQGVDQDFEIMEGGLFALELYEGDYTATTNVPGFKPKTASFTVIGGKEIQVSIQLEADAPVDTPNVSATSKAIRVKKPIRYDGDSVAASSHAILDELAAFLNGHPEILLVEVGVHTDDRGAAQKRSQSRADSVVSYLVGKGVSASRLQAKGYGASKPIAVNMTAAGRAKNNRTGLSIKQRQ